MPGSMKMHDPRLGRVMLWAALAALALNVLGSVLALPGGQGPEPFLALGADDLVLLDTVREAWSRLVLVAVGPLQASLSAVALLYFALDTIAFMPLYGLLFFEVARRLAEGGARRSSLWAARALVLLTPSLLAVDLVENTGGLARLAGGGGALVLVGALAVGAAALAWWLWRGPLAGPSVLRALAELQPRWSVWPRRFPRVLIAAALAAAALLLAHGFAPAAALRAGAWVHGAKQALVGAIALVFVALALAWVFRRDGAQSGRAALRRGLVDILWRTRYVLAALAGLVAFTLVMDQCRDVAVGMADGLFAWPQAPWAWPTALISVIAVWALSFSCWLWTRLVLRMPAPGAGAQDLPEDVEVTLRSAARGVARLLGVAPAFVAALMSALAARDAIWAAAGRETPWVLSPLLLLGMGLACVLGAFAFLWDRERMSHRGGTAQEDYYNDPAFAPGTDWLAQVAADKYRFAAARGPGPFSLPIIAIALAVGLRCLAAAAEPGVPLAFAVIVFALVGWLGVFGWLSIKEQRDSRPWLLLLIVFIGALGFAGFTDNHVVRVIVAPSGGAALPGVGWQIAGSLGLAGLVLAAGWAVARGGARCSWPKVMGGVGLAAVVLLVAFDRMSHREQREAAAAPAIALRPSVDQAIERWLDTLWDQGRGTPPQQVFLVASEGGGVRAAYWTARTLQGLHEQVRDFDRRTLMLSGVSGGAVGEAVYRACKGEGACIDRFGQADLLTPLLGAWLFEDFLARVLPTSLPDWMPTPRWLEGLCRQPGCGFLSRGLWFEQTLERAVPGLALGIGSDTAGMAGMPHLLLNATWVETGDRAIAASVTTDWQVDRFTNVRDQIEVAGRGRSHPVDLPLSAAAHNAARFPFVNAIGRLRSVEGAQGHLADGGYFDNGGAHTTIDMLAMLQRWITQRPTCADTDAACQRHRRWLHSLRPTVIVIQNGVTEACTQPTADARLACLRRSWALEQTAAAEPYRPAAPAQAGRLSLFADLLGPLVTVVNVAGTGANGRRAEALLQEQCRAFGNPDCAVQLAQRSDGLLYPLGWYLSPTARRALDEQASARVGELAAAFNR